MHPATVHLPKLYKFVYCLAVAISMNVCKLSMPTTWAIHKILYSIQKTQMCSFKSTERYETLKVITNNTGVTSTGTALFYSFSFFLRLRSDFHKVWKVTKSMLD